MKVLLALMLTVVVRPFDEPGIFRVDVVNQTTGDVFVRFAPTDTVMFTARAMQATSWNVDYFDGTQYTKTPPPAPMVARSPAGPWVSSLPGVNVNFIDTHASF